MVDNILQFIEAELAADAASNAAPATSSSRNHKAMEHKAAAR